MLNKVSESFAKLTKPKKRLSAAQTRMLNRINRSKGVLKEQSLPPTTLAECGKTIHFPE